MTDFDYKRERLFDYLIAQYIDALFYNLDVEKDCADWYCDALDFLVDHYEMPLL